MIWGILNEWVIGIIRMREVIWVMGMMVGVMGMVGMIGGYGDENDGWNDWVLGIREVIGMRRMRSYS
ncbi:MAG: hypothetical protein ACOCUU_01960 [Nanoarchaeota archaeon]